MKLTSYIVGFIGGLRGKLKNFGHMLKPTTLDDEMTLVMLHEGGV